MVLCCMFKSLLKRWVWNKCYHQNRGNWEIYREDYSDCGKVYANNFADYLSLNLLYIRCVHFQVNGISICKSQIQLFSHTLTFTHYYHPATFSKPTISHSCVNKWDINPHSYLSLLEVLAQDVWVIFFTYLRDTMSC